MKKKIFLSAAILAAAVSAYAQGNGQAGITEATNYNPQIEMFARFKMKSSFHKTKRII